MSELNGVAPEDLPEVVRIASELYEEDRTREEERELRLGWEAAASEVDIPPERVLFPTRRPSLGSGCP